MTHKLEFCGNRNQIVTAVFNILTLYEAHRANTHVQSFMEAKGKEKSDSILGNLERELWFDFKRQALAERYPVVCDDLRPKLAGYIEPSAVFPGGYRIVPITIIDVGPSAAEIEIWRNKEICTIKVPDDQEVRVFGRVLYKLGGDFRNLKMPIEINGEILQLGHWMAAYLCKMMGDTASYNQYHDYGLEKA